MTGAITVLVAICLIVKPIHMVWRAYRDSVNPPVSQLRRRQLEDIIHRPPPPPSKQGRRRR